MVPMYGSKLFQGSHPKLVHTSGVLRILLLRNLDARKLDA